MEFAFSFQKILDGNGLAISMTGMFIVFSALITITVFVFLLPKMLKLFNNIFPEEEEGIVFSEPRVDGKEIVAAIGYALAKSKNNA